MSDLMELLARDLARKFEVFVFPAWGEEGRVFAQDDGRIRYIGISMSRWRKLVCDNMAATGYDLMQGAKNIRVTMVQPEVHEIEVLISPHWPTATWRRVEDAPPPDALDIRTLRIARPRGPIPAPSIPQDLPLFRR